jgi:hypothetical protein
MAATLSLSAKGRAAAEMLSNTMAVTEGGSQHREAAKANKAAHIHYAPTTPHRKSSKVKSSWTQKREKKLVSTRLEPPKLRIGANPSPSRPTHASCKIQGR